MTLAEYRDEQAKGLERWNATEGRWEGGMYDLSPEAAETFYRTAYEHGTAAFDRGEERDACSYGYSVIYGDLGVRGWQNGWRDAYAATVQPLWWDDSSYAAYQAMD